MKLLIHQDVFSKFHPRFSVGFILAKDLHNRQNLRESIHLLGEAENIVHLTFNKATAKNHYLIKPWAAAQQEFGKEAKHYHTCVETLLKQVLAKKNIASNDVLTNLLNYLSLKYLVPLGADDSEKIKGPITFAVGRTGKRNGLYYQDKTRILGTKLDYWKNPTTKLTAKSTSALIHVDCLPPLTSDKLEKIVTELMTLIEEFCGAKVKRVILSKKKAQGTL